MLPAEHADALRFHVSVRQRDESLAEARRVPRAHPRVGDRGRPQGGGLQRVRADDSPGRPGAGEDGRGIRVFARRRAFTESGRADGKIPSRCEVPCVPVYRRGRRWSESSVGFGRHQLRTALESRTPRAADWTSPPFGPSPSSPRGAPADQGQHRRARVGDAEGEEIAVRGRFRFISRRGKFRGARTKEHSPGCEGNLRRPAGTSKACY